MESNELILEAEENHYEKEVRERLLESLQERGLKFIEPSSYELFIDCDSEEQFKVFLQQLLIVERNLEQELPFQDWFSRSGPPRRHIIVQMPFTMSPPERIAWQAVLGSDLKREVLSLLRWRKKEICPTIFIEQEDFNKGGNNA